MTTIPPRLTTDQATTIHMIIADAELSTLAFDLEQLGPLEDAIQEASGASMDLIKARTSKDAVRIQAATTALTDAETKLASKASIVYGDLTKIVERSTNLLVAFDGIITGDPNWMDGLHRAT